MQTFLVMIAGEGVLTAMLAWGMPKAASIWHYASAAVLGLAWFLLCLVYLG